MICTRCRGWFKSIAQKIDNVLINNVESCIYVTTRLKQMLESSTAITLTELTPIGWDDVSRQMIAKALGYALKGLGFIKDIKDLSDATVTDVKDTLSQLPKEQRNAMLLKIASLMASKIDNHKEKQNVYDSATQLTYTMKKEQNKL